MKHSDGEHQPRHDASPKGGAAKRAKSAPGVRQAGRTNSDRAVERGEATGVAGTMTRADRYRRMYDAWRRGIDAGTIAAEHGCSVRRVRQIVDQLRAADYADEATAPAAAIAYMDRLIAQLDYAVAQAAEIQQRAFDSGNLSVALGASRRVAEARREALELRQARGLVPRNLGNLVLLEDAVQFVQRINAVFERHGIPDSIRHEIAALIEMDQQPEDGGLALPPLADDKDEPIVIGTGTNGANGPGAQRSR